MVWRAEDPQGHEALKVRYDIVPYLGDTLLDIGCGATKVFDYAVGIDSLRCLDCFFGCFDDESVQGLCSRYAGVQRLCDFHSFKFTLGNAIADRGNAES